MKYRHTLSLLAMLPITLLLNACGDPDDPEARIRQFIETAELRVENREFTEIMGMISGDYADSRGNDKFAIVGILRAYFLRHKSIHLFIRIGEIEFLRPDHATVSIQAFMAGTPFSQDEGLRIPDSDFHKFDFELIEDGGDWQLARAEWTRAASAQIF
ncbi:MAG: hypothetical protein MJA83_08995 [Gammaproteobacteria bacterium]|nr:hypothetical protein [Gammaproteobacteria bacterium]